MKYIIYNKAGTILRVVNCHSTLADIQTKNDEFIMEGDADDATQKIVAGKLVNKTVEEIRRDNPTPSKVKLPKSKMLALVTNEQWENVLKRLANLENK